MRYLADTLPRRFVGAIHNNPTSELTVHFLKHNRLSKRPLYTVAVWEDSHLRAICHVAPIDSVLSALRREVESLGEPFLDSPEKQEAKRGQLFSKTKVRFLKLISVLLRNS